MQRYNLRRRRPPKDDSAVYGRSNELSELQVEAERSLRGEFPTPAAGRLVHTSSALISDGSIRHKVFRLGNAQPPSVTLLKELLGPAVVVTTLALCLSLCRVRLSLDCVALGLVTFLVANRVLSTPESHNDLNGRLQIRPTLPRLLLEWVTISALVAFLTSALSFAHLFPRAAGSAARPRGRQAQRADCNAPAAQGSCSDCLSVSDAGVLLREQPASGRAEGALESAPVRV